MFGYMHGCEKSRSVPETIPPFLSGTAKTCQANGCQVELSSLGRRYCMKRGLCNKHLAANAICIPNREGLWRLCQQCGKVQPLSDFDGLKRSCRAGLARRRKLAARLADKRFSAQLGLSGLPGGVTLDPVPAPGYGSSSDHQSEYNTSSSTLDSVGLKHQPGFKPDTAGPAVADMHQHNMHGVFGRLSSPAVTGTPEAQLQTALQPDEFAELLCSAGDVPAPGSSLASLNTAGMAEKIDLQLYALEQYIEAELKHAAQQQHQPLAAATSDTMSGGSAYSTGVCPVPCRVAVSSCQAHGGRSRWSCQDPAATGGVWMPGQRGSQAAMGNQREVLMASLACRLQQVAMEYAQVSDLQRAISTLHAGEMPDTPMPGTAVTDSTRLVLYY